ncbi:polycystic kidney disease protein 1-like 3, partial [Striga asiatica]
HVAFRRNCGLGRFVSLKGLGGVGRADEWAQPVVGQEWLVVGGEEHVRGLEVAMWEIEGGEIRVEVGQPTGDPLDYLQPDGPRELRVGDPAVACHTRSSSTSRPSCNDTPAASANSCASNSRAFSPPSRTAPSPSSSSPSTSSPPPSAHPPCSPCKTTPKARSPKPRPPPSSNPLAQTLPSPRLSSPYPQPPYPAYPTLFSPTRAFHPLASPPPPEIARGMLCSKLPSAVLLSCLRFSTYIPIIMRAKRTTRDVNRAQTAIFILFALSGHGLPRYAPQSPGLPENESGPNLDRPAGSSPSRLLLERLSETRLGWSSVGIGPVNRLFSRWASTKWAGRAREGGTGPESPARRLPSGLKSGSGPEKELDVKLTIRSSREAQVAEAEARDKAIRAIYAGPMIVFGARLCPRLPRVESGCKSFGFGNRTCCRDYEKKNVEKDG